MVRISNFMNNVRRNKTLTVRRLDVLIGRELSHSVHYEVEKKVQENNKISLPIGVAQDECMLSQKMLIIPIELFGFDFDLLKTAFSRYLDNHKWIFTRYHRAIHGKDNKDHHILHFSNAPNTTICSRSRNKMVEDSHQFRLQYVDHTENADKFPEKKARGAGEFPKQEKKKGSPPPDKHPFKFNDCWTKEAKKEPETKNKEICQHEAKHSDGKGGKCKFLDIHCNTDGNITYSSMLNGTGFNPLFSRKQITQFVQSPSSQTVIIRNYSKKSNKIKILDQSKKKDNKESNDLKMANMKTAEQFKQEFVDMIVKKDNSNPSQQTPKAQMVDINTDEDTINGNATVTLCLSKIPRSKKGIDLCGYISNCLCTPMAIKDFENMGFRVNAIKIQNNEVTLKDMRDEKILEIKKNFETLPIVIKNDNDSGFIVSKPDKKEYKMVFSRSEDQNICTFQSLCSDSCKESTTAETSDMEKKGPLDFISKKLGFLNSIKALYGAEMIAEAPMSIVDQLLNDAPSAEKCQKLLKLFSELDTSHHSPSMNKPSNNIKMEESAVQNPDLKTIKQNESQKIMDKVVQKLLEDQDNTIKQAQESLDEMNIPSKKLADEMSIPSKKLAVTNTLNDDENKNQNEEAIKSQDAKGFQVETNVSNQNNVDVVRLEEPIVSMNKTKLNEEKVNSYENITIDQNEMMRKEAFVKEMDILKHDTDVYILKTNNLEPLDKEHIDEHDLVDFIETMKQIDQDYIHEDEDRPFFKPLSTFTEAPNLSDEMKINEEFLKMQEILENIDSGIESKEPYLENTNELNDYEEILPDNNTAIKRENALKMLNMFEDSESPLSDVCKIPKLTEVSDKDFENRSRISTLIRYNIGETFDIVGHAAQFCPKIPTNISNEITENEEAYINELNKNLELIPKASEKEESFTSEFRRIYEQECEKIGLEISYTLDPLLHYSSIDQSSTKDVSPLSKESSNIKSIDKKSTKKETDEPNTTFEFETSYMQKQMTDYENSKSRKSSQSDDTSGSNERIPIADYYGNVLDKSFDLANTSHPSKGHKQSEEQSQESVKSENPVKASSILDAFCRNQVMNQYQLKDSEKMESESLVNEIKNRIQQQKNQVVEPSPTSSFQRQSKQEEQHPEQNESSNSYNQQKKSVISSNPALNQVSDPIVSTKTFSENKQSIEKKAPSKDQGPQKENFVPFELTPLTETSPMSTVEANNSYEREIPSPSNALLNKPIQILEENKQLEKKSYENILPKYREQLDASDLSQDKISHEDLDASQTKFKISANSTDRNEFRKKEEEPYKYDFQWPPKSPTETPQRPSTEADEKYQKDAKVLEKVIQETSEARQRVMEKARYFKEQNEEVYRENNPNEEAETKAQAYIPNTIKHSDASHVPKSRKEIELEAFDSSVKEARFVSLRESLRYVTQMNETQLKESIKTQKIDALAEEPSTSDLSFEKSKLKATIESIEQHKNAKENLANTMPKKDPISVKVEKLELLELQGIIDVLKKALPKPSNASNQKFSKDDQIILKGQRQNVCDKLVDTSNYLQSKTDGSSAEAVVKNDNSKVTILMGKKIKYKSSDKNLEDYTVTEELTNINNKIKQIKVISIPKRSIKESQESYLKNVISSEYESQEELQAQLAFDKAKTNKQNVEGLQESLITQMNQNPNYGNSQPNNLVDIKRYVETFAVRLVQNILMAQLNMLEKHIQERKQVLADGTSSTSFSNSGFSHNLVQNNTTVSYTANGLSSSSKTDSNNSNEVSEDADDSIPPKKKND